MIHMTDDFDEPLEGEKNRFIDSTAYTEKLYRVDQDYRQFIELANQTEQAGWDMLKPLRRSVDDCYSGWFMERLSMGWGDFLEPDSSSDSQMSQSANKTATTALLDTWRLPRILNQYNLSCWAQTDTWGSTVWNFRYQREMESSPCPVPVQTPKPKRPSRSPLTI